MLAAFLSAVLATGLEQSEPSDAGDLGLQLRSPLRDRAPHREDRAGPAAGVEQSRPPSDAFTPRVAVYIYPFSTAEMFIAGQMSSPPGGGNVLALYGAGGASVRLSDKVGLDVEVGGGMLARQTLGWVFSAGVGPSLQLTGDEHFRGLFIATRFRFQVFQPAQLVPLSVDSNEGPADLGPGLARAFLGEIDVGYHLRAGRFYFAPVLGIGVGYAYDYVDSTGVRFLSPFTNPSTSKARPQGIVWSVNLNLARLGLAL